MLYGMLEVQSFEDLRKTALYSHSSQKLQLNERIFLEKI